jgi:hypothetical protein
LLDLSGIYGPDITETGLRATAVPEPHILRRTRLHRISTQSKGIAMQASSLSFRSAVIFVVAGMVIGLGMAISKDHALMPAHAHLNLLGWVSLFLFGIYYKLHPVADTSRLAFAQVWVWIAATIVLTIGVAGVHLGYDSLEPLAAVGSLVALADILLFGVLVFRPAPGDDRAASPAAAE